MRTETQRAYDRAWYEAHRDAVLAKARKRRLKRTESDREAIRKYRRKWWKESEKASLAKEKKREMYKTEEYRAKRRAAYAAKHANDPMTPHRKACVEAMRKITRTPIEERRAKKQELLAKKQALNDIREEQL